MASTTIDFGNDANGKSGPGASNENYALKICQLTSNCLVHVLIGATVFVCLIFAFRLGLPLNPMNLHIVLCVIGYQLLMAEGILALSPSNGWTATMTLVHKRRVHWVLQVVGAGLAMAGSCIMSLDKAINWNTLHGQFGLVALVFTVVSLVNGLTSLYAYEMRKCIPGILSKLTHICFGIVGFAAASISLIYGFDKNSFRNWATVEVAYTMFAVTALFTTIMIIDPFITFFKKSKGIFSR